MPDVEVQIEEPGAESTAPERSDPNTIGGKQVPSAPDGAGESTGGVGGGPISGAEDARSSRGPIVSVPEEGELPGVRSAAVSRTPDQVIAEYRAKGGKPEDPVVERRLAQMFMDEEFDEEKFQEMRSMKNVDTTPDPHKYDDPRNYAQNEARKRRMDR